MRVDSEAGTRLRTVMASTPVRLRPPRRAKPAETVEPVGSAVVEPIDPSGGPVVVESAEPAAGNTARVPVRRRITATHLQALAIAAVAVLVFLSLHLLRARPSELPLEPLPVAAGSELGSPQTSAGSTSVAPNLTVHVVGEVKRPGVVTLAAGARVHDAIQAAGGLTAKARLGALNLAAPLVDGSQVVVGGPESDSQTMAPSGAGGKSAGGAQQVDLNTATQAELETLPGVGPVMAQKIIGWREQNGRFHRVEDLQEVDGVGAKTFERLKPLVKV